MSTAPFPANDNQTTEAARPARGCDTSHLWPLIFLMAIAGGSAFGLYLFHLNSPETIDFEFHLPLFLFAILGVVFHMASKYREVRDEGAFSLGKYWFDHLFRIFQACLYVLIIDNWEKGAEPVTIRMAVVALLVGMYIRKVEVAFESLGDRFGEMLKSLLGASSQQVTAEERTERIKILKEELERLQQDYLAQAADPEQIPAEVRQGFQVAMEQLHDGCPDEAEKFIRDIGFKLKGLAATDKTSN